MPEKFLFFNPQMRGLKIDVIILMERVTGKAFYVDNPYHLSDIEYVDRVFSEEFLPHLMSEFKNTPYTPRTESEIEARCIQKVLDMKYHGEIQ